MATKIIIPDSGKRWEAFRVRLDPPTSKATLEFFEGPDDKGVLCQTGTLKTRGPEIAIFLSKPRIIDDVPHENILPGEFFVRVTVKEKDGTDTIAEKKIEVLE